MTPPRQGGGGGIGLSAEAFEDVFPFHLAFDGDLRLVQAGRSVARVCDDVRPGARLADTFRFIQPGIEATAAVIQRYRDRFFLLQHRKTGLQLRGELLPADSQGLLVFIGSPWFRDAAEITLHGLAFEDFAVHDPVVDMLQVFQASKLALGDAKKLAAKLSAQRAQLREANDRLREKEAESRTLALVAARTDNAVVLTDAEGRTVWVNEGFVRLTGYSLGEMLGKKPGGLLQGAGTDRAVVQRIGEKLRQGEGFREELLNYARDGRPYWVAIEVQPIREADGRITHFMAIEADITARRTAEEALRSAKDAAEAANRAKSEFLAMMSHEIRTPMNAVLGMTHLLLETRLDGQQAEFAQTVARSGEALLEIINDILDFSKIEAGEHFPLEEEVFSLRTVVGEVVQLLRARAGAKRLGLTWEVEGGLEDSFVGDDGRLRQVLVNLVGNGLKFTDLGGVRILVSSRDGGGDRAHLRFEVEDTGIGMETEQAAGLFQPFSQVGGEESRRRGGTGLGLAISKRIVERMGGRIGAHSAPECGSTFWFELDLPVAPTDGLGNASEAVGSPRLAVWFEGRDGKGLSLPETRPSRVLVVEDNDTNRRLAMFILRRFGVRTEFAHDGVEAVEAWERGHPDLILMDCQMPLRDGFEATREIRRREAERGVDARSRVAIIALTANALNGDRERCRDAGMDGYISKPFTASRLAEALGIAVEHGITDERVSGRMVDGLDTKRLIGLRLDLGDEGARSIIEEARRELPRRVAELVGRAEAGDFAIVARLAHTLQGTGGLLGLASLVARMTVLEAEALAGNGVRMREAARGLASDVERDMAALLDEIGTWPKDPGIPRSIGP